MACTSPLKAYKYGLTENGKQKLVFKLPEHFDVTEENTQLVPCGKCISCKLSYAKEWALRITHHASLTEANCFITLTYNNENLPPDRSVHRYEVQNFIKRLRKYLTKTYGRVKIGQRINKKTGELIDKYEPKVKIHTFYCGEYGESAGKRPHYHIIVLGYDFTDKQYLKTSGAGFTLWESNILDSLWVNEKGESKGFANLGEVTFESAGYVARYCMKKSKNKKDYKFVDGYDEETGEIKKILDLEPEFIGMSQGIGKLWHQLFKQDTDKDYLQTNGFKHKIPRYYDKLREKENPDELEKIKQRRQERAKENLSEQTPTRRRAKNIVKEAQNNMLHRELDND